MTPQEQEQITTRINAVIDELNDILTTVYDMGYNRGISGHQMTTLHDYSLGEK